MKLSIIIPTFNSGVYLTQTLDSIQAQTYTNYEVLLADGGSTDNTLRIIERYKFVKIASRKDKSQTDGINKAIIHCSGDIIAWQNSDDIYNENCFREVVEAFEKNTADIIYGSYDLIGPTGNVIKRCASHEWDLLHFKTGRFVPLQPTLFWRKKVSDAIFPLDPSLKYCMDVDFLAKASNKNYKFHALNSVLGAFRIHQAGKTSEWLNTKKVLKEHFAVLKSNFDYSFVDNALLVYNLTRIFGIKFFLNIFNRS